MMDTKAQSVINITTETDPTQFWQEQIKLKQASGLSRRAYCREHGLIHSRFAYWEHKLTKGSLLSSQKLLPITIEAIALQTSVLCSLRFKNGSELKIHDPVVLSTVISLLS